jgi:hypothetical protein
MEDAYIAGLFDGEGSVGIYRTTNGKRLAAGGAAPSAGKKYWSTALSISGTHRPMLEEVCRHVPGATFFHDNRRRDTVTPTRVYVNGTTRALYKVQLAKRSCVGAFLRRIRPYLWEKAEQADIVLQFLDDEIDGSVASELCRKAKHFKFEPGGAKPQEQSDKEPSANASLTFADAQMIRTLVTAGQRQNVVARDMGINAGIVSSIVSGKTYRGAPPLPNP